MKPNRLWLAIASSVMASQLMAGEAVFYVTEDGEAVRDLTVAVDGKKKLVGKSGFVSFDVPAGSHTVELSQFGEYLGEFDFDTANDEQNAEIQVEMIGGEALPEINVFTPGQEAEVALGQISGYLESADTGGPISGARVSVDGTEQGVVTDEDGFFSFELPRGEYNLLIADPNYGKRDVNGIRVMGNVNTGVNLNMSLEGDGVIEEVVAVGTYVPSTGAAQERDSSAVLDSIGSEQFSRFGDSDAASALKRVAGVTISNGKYVVVRGLNERHSTITLNGATLPSPDPARRVVPLDIFPSTIIDGIAVQKNFTPDVYADSTGGVIKLTTKKFPEEFEGKFSASLTYVDDLTGEDRQVQESEPFDALGFGAEWDRRLPKYIDDIEGSLNDGTASDLESQAALRLLPDNLETKEKRVLPNGSLELSLGDTIYDGDSLTLGYTTSLRYENSWSRQDRKRNTYRSTGSEIIQDDSFEDERTINDITLGWGASLGLISGDNEYSSNTLVLRQTQNDTTVTTGVGGDQDRELNRYRLLWIEREFLMQQFTGKHYFDNFFETELNWQASVSQAKLDQPDEREYSFERNAESSDPFLLFLSTTGRTYNELTDDNTDFNIDLSSLLYTSDSMDLSLKYGVGYFSREREAEGTRLTYRTGSRTAADYPNNFNPDEILEGLADSGELSLSSNSTPADDYDAEWNMLTYYLTSAINWFDIANVEFGLRVEDSDLSVDTFTQTSTTANPEPVSSELDESDVFPAVSSTFFINEDMQLRAAYYETKNRPDFRELANAQFTEVETGDLFRGNPDLETSDIDNIDLRFEYYFSDSENVTLAYFMKDFDNPIERTLLQGGSVYSYANGEEGELSGFEIDFRKEFEMAGGDLNSFVSGNLAFIDSDVEISVEGEAPRSQRMQGQPDELANLQLGLDDFENGTEYTLVVNYQGDSIDSVGSGDLPNIIKEPRSEINLSVKQEIFESSKVSFSLDNITDEKVELTQGGRNFRSYKEGVEFSLGFSTEF